MVSASYRDRSFRLRWRDQFEDLQGELRLYTSVTDLDAFGAVKVAPLVVGSSAEVAVNCERAGVQTWPLGATARPYSQPLVPVLSAG